MKLLTTGRALFAALLAGGLLAIPTPARAADVPGVLRMYDDAGLFSAGAKSQAEQKLSSAKFDRGLHFTVETFKAIPDAEKGSYSPDQKALFFRNWAKKLATGDKAKGPYVLICMNPGYTEVIIDEETLKRGFTNANTNELHRIFNSALVEAAKKPPAERGGVRDAALVRAAEYVSTDLAGTKVVNPTTGKPASAKANADAGGRSIMSWVCIGLTVLLGVWLVIGLIRMFTGGGGGYGGGGYGGGPGYGGGGGGFFSGLMGGMFGAMAGMWLYNNMFGGSSFGNDAYANDAGATGDTGAGDYDNGTDAGGGGDYGGGDTGGGGGDYGGGDYGGGDYGGGGDFGGGGDYGGGGDF